MLTITLTTPSSLKSVCFLFFSILQIYKDSQFNNTKIKNSKIQLRNKTQTFKKSYTFLNKVCTRRGHININNNNNNNNIDNNNNNNNNIYIYIYINWKREERETETETETKTDRDTERERQRQRQRQRDNKISENMQLGNSWKTAST